MLTRMLARMLAGLLYATLASILAMPAGARDFAVYPLRIDFAPGERSSAVGVSNADTRPIRFQLKLVEWTQDAEGKDVYKESDELIYFPRLFTVPAGEQGVARVGPKRLYTGNERTFRLFIEELPDPDEKPGGTGIKFNIRFAVPVFVGAPGAKAKAVIEPLELKSGKLNAMVRNAGSAHFRIDSLELIAQSGYNKKSDGWYLLAGASRLHTLELPRKDCLAAKHLDVKVKIGEEMLSAGLDVTPGMCGI